MNIKVIIKSWKNGNIDTNLEIIQSCINHQLKICDSCCIGEQITAGKIGLLNKNDNTHSDSCIENPKPFNKRINYD